MTYALKCQQCGHKNTLGKLFCANCGAKLDMSQAQSYYNREGARRWQRFFFRLLRASVTLLLLLALGLLLWPAEQTGREGTQADGENLKLKMQLLDAAVEEQRMLQLNLSEAEINGYLSGILESTHPEGASSPLPYKLKSINMAFIPDHYTLMLTAALGPLTLTYELGGQVVRNSENWDFQISKVRMGHLPMPAQAEQWMAKRVSIVFSKLDREKGLMDSMDEIQVGAGSVNVGTSGRRI